MTNQTQLEVDGNCFVSCNRFKLTFYIACNSLYTKLPIFFRAESVRNFHLLLPGFKGSKNKNRLRKKKRKIRMRKFMNCIYEKFHTFPCHTSSDFCSVCCNKHTNLKYIFFHADEQLGVVVIFMKNIKNLDVV